ncbi:unnamed protein product [Brugia pahangi]|uniref:G_PROTEIN_RECEP_F1_2 domain-containing protein n=1 Tax=Brugia pahangi TaxID=6280 RepID=A0A0N4T1E1_BRUPA|nr:unnamed protein product [Brugia pahangi]
MDLYEFEVLKQFDMMHHFCVLMKNNVYQIKNSLRVVTVVVAICAISQAIARLKSVCYETISIILDSKCFFGRYSVPLELFLHMSSKFNGEYGMIVYMMIFIDFLIPGLVRSELQIE